MSSHSICEVLCLTPMKRINRVAPRVPKPSLLVCRVNSIFPESSRKNASGRSVNHERNIWDPTFFESLQNNFKEEIHTSQVEQLKRTVRDMLNDTTSGSLAKLILIDDLQRLGVAYHFEKEIKIALHGFCISKDACIEDDLYSMALYFRLLREHGFKISQDVLRRFIDDEADFPQNLREDAKGMLNVYEASQLCLEGENILDEANEFVVKHLALLKDCKDLRLAKEVTHALELPLHRRMPRLEARYYIDEYEEKEDMNPVLLQLAKLDFNHLQAIHRNELSDLSRWWKNLGLSDKLSSRDRLVESYVWSVGVAHKPQYRCCREWITKVTCHVITIDDIYDIYGLLSELELFTSVVERWDLEAVEHLPDYMRICYLALFNTTNDIVYTKYKEEGVYILPQLKKEWIDFCKSMLVEAKWSKCGYTPSLKEYLEIASVSSSGGLGLVHALLGTNQVVLQNVLESLNNTSDTIYYSSMVIRLCNDLATSSVELERGDVPSAVQCYMHEANASERVARDKIKHLISEMWKKLNESIFESPFERSFVDIAMNMARSAHSIYQYGDGFTVQDHEARRRVGRLFLQPITIKRTDSSLCH